MEVKRRTDHKAQLTQGIVAPKSLRRRVVDKALRAAGYEPLKTWEVERYVDNYVHASLLREVFAAKKVDCVFDVGAFNGHFGRFLRNQVGFKGTILSFEPQPGPFKVLEEWSQRDGNWQAFNVGLGAAPGAFTMNVMDKLWFSSFLPPSSATPQNMSARNSVVSSVTARVETISQRYDELAAQYGFVRPFLKMDTQGFDLKVVQGARERLDQFVGLQSELSVIPIYEGMPDWRTALSAYEAAGFSLSGFFPVSSDGNQRAVEVDVLMVR